ncbi:MAG: DUF4838 domain-containing protein [Acidobacteriota bacterium]
MFCLSPARILWSAVLAAGLCAAAADTRAQIAADFSPYGSSAEASAAALTETNLSTKATLYAAEELRTYLCRLSGVPSSDASRFPIIDARNAAGRRARFRLARLDDPAQRAAVKDLVERAGALAAEQSFALIPSNGQLHLIGHDSTGLLYAVYHFLELQGVRWYAPGPEGEFVPRPHTLRTPESAVVQRPQFFTRGFWAWEPRGNRDFHVWMARNRFNFWTVADRDGLFLRMLGFQLNAGGHWFFERYLNPEDEYPYRVPGLAGGAGKSPDPYPQDPSEFRGDPNHDGKLTYFEAHPEWYGLVGGQRRTFKGAFGVNVCSSNPHVMAELGRRIVKELAEGEWRHAAILDFWALDVGKWCECDRCRALGTPTDRLLRMVHQVRTAVTEAELGKTLKRPIVVYFPIYAETLAAPARPLPQGFDYERTIGTLFPIHRCYRHALDDPDCRETNAQIWDTILGWQRGERFYRGGFVMGEYYNVSTTKSLPVLYTRRMAHDIPLYYARGVRHFHYMHVPTSLPGFKRWTNYLLGRLLWNPKADPQALADEYFRDFYGKAAGDLGELYGRLEEAMSAIHQWKSDRQRLTGRINGDLDPLFPLKHLPLSRPAPDSLDRGVPLERSVEELKACRAIMDRVLGSAQTPLLRARLLEDDRNLRYAESTVSLYYFTARAILARRAGDLENAKSWFAQTLPHAKALQGETAIVQSSSSHANAADGLQASLIEPGWKRLGAELGTLRE